MNQRAVVMNQRIVGSREYRIFVNESNKIKEYFKKKLIPPTEVNNKYQDSLKKYNRFLDCIGISKVIPKYKYSYEDKRTWKYVNVTINGKEYIRAIENPSFERVA